MPEENIQYEVHDYGPLNKYIDERSRIRRTRSVWGYTRSLALFLIALGIFLILAAYAYHIFKKPHPINLIEKDQIEFEDGKKKIESDIISKKDEINKVEEEIKNNPENEKLKKELEALKEEKKELEKKISEQGNIKVNVTKFVTEENVLLGNINVDVITRIEFKKSTDESPYRKTCYVDFNSDDLNKVELGTKNNNLPNGVSQYHLDKLNVTENDFRKLRKKCYY